MSKLELTKEEREAVRLAVWGVHTNTAHLVDIVIDAVNEVREKEIKREDYAFKIGTFVTCVLNPKDSPFTNGSRLLVEMLSEGWTPPKGLF